MSDALLALLKSILWICQEITANGGGNASYYFNKEVLVKFSNLIQSL